MNVSIVIWIISAHWLADFVLQSDWMAKKKSTNHGALAAHTLVYGIFLILFMIPYGAPKSEIIVWGIVNMLLHGSYDFLSSHLNSYLWRRNEVHYFFVSIGFDQLIHYICLFSTWVWLIGGLK